MSLLDFLRASTPPPKRPNPAPVPRAPAAGHLESLADYLNGGLDMVDPRPFAPHLERYFDEEKEGEIPEDFDPSSPASWLDTPAGAAALDDFRAWLEREVFEQMLNEADPNTPSYLFYQRASVAPVDWLVHFTNSAEAVAREGLRLGHPDRTALGLTNYKKTTGPGWNFALPALSQPAEWVADGGNDYGESAVLFQSASVSAFHTGDGEEQNLVWGPSIRAFLRLDRLDPEEGDLGHPSAHRLRPWAVHHRINGAVLAKGDYLDVAAWAISHAGDPAITWTPEAT